MPCGRGSVLLCWRCDTLCTFGFMDDITFGRNERDSKTWRAHHHREATTTSGVAIPWRSLMSMNALFDVVARCRPSNASRRHQQRRYFKVKYAKDGSKVKVKFEADDIVFQYSGVDKRNASQSRSSKVCQSTSSLDWAAAPTSQ